jgi:hypothetical protein
MPDINHDSAAPTTPEEAFEAARNLFETGDDTHVAAAAEAMLSQDSEQAFAIMRGSGNDMDAFERFVSLCRDAGLFTRGEAVDLLFEYSDLSRGARP